MALTKKQQELIGAISVINTVKTPYWDMFAKARAPYMALSNVIRVDEVMNTLIEAGIVARGTSLPSLTIDGHSTVTVKPDVVGGSIGISALDTLNANAGEVVVVNGEQIKVSKYDETKKLETLKSSIDNTKEKMATQALLTGEVATAGGKKVNLALNAETEITKTEKTYLSFFTRIVNNYFQETGHYPSRILIGSDIIDGIITDIQTSPKGIEMYSISATANGGMKISITGVGVTIEGFPINSIGVDTSSKIHVMNDATFVPIYAGLEFIGTTGSPEMIRAEVISDITAANEETGTSKIFAKSAPFPVIILPNLLKRYILS